jgi:ABC-2 type transport system ATP-binding protein
VFHSYLKQFDVPEKRKVGELSKGTKTKFALAAALAHEPELLIMDEPTSGLDPIFRREVLSIISEYIRDGERSVLFSTHISADLERIADYIVYVRNGKLRFTGSKEQLLDAYMLVRGPAGLLERIKLPFAGLQQTALGFEGLLPIEHYSDELLGAGVAAERPTLDDILVFTQGGK